MEAKNSISIRSFQFNVISNLLHFFFLFLCYASVFFFFFFFDEIRTVYVVLSSDNRDYRQENENKLGGKKKKMAAGKAINLQIHFTLLTLIIFVCTSIKPYAYLEWNTRQTFMSYAHRRYNDALVRNPSPTNLLSFDFLI